MKNLKVQPIPGEDGRFWVDSESHPDEDRYVVDLNETPAQCHCTDFNARCLPKWREVRAAVPYPEKGRTECKHIAAVREYESGAWMRELLGKKHGRWQVVAATPDTDGFLLDLEDGAGNQRQIHSNQL